MAKRLVTRCIYHGQCQDGFAAAWVVKKWWEIQHRGDMTDILFYAGTYQRPPPDCKGQNVIIVDFSYKRAAMEAIYEECNTLTWLDHHKSALEDMAGFKGDERFSHLLSQEHSGSMLTWMHFFPDLEPPQLLKHIQDRDLWRFALPGTKEISAAVFSHPFDFTTWDLLMTPQLIPALLAEGVALVRAHDQDVVHYAHSTLRFMDIGGNMIPVANVVPSLSSDVGHLLAKQAELGHYANRGLGETPTFAATYCDREKERVFSLRSLEGGADVSLIAIRYGGGGHKHAAGFSVPRSHRLAME